jgi:hypothetical protein
MKMSLAAFVLICCCCSASAQQSPIDKYLSSAPQLTIIANATNKLSSPQDLDFCRVPGRENELWILNKGDGNGGSVVIAYDAGTSKQWTEYRHDSHAAHFMRNASGIAMGANGNFGTSADILNTVGNTTTTFMGPSLWDSDTTKFARVNQNDWVDGELLGSHLDMQHESPYTMGIAADTGNVYWVFDGYNKAIYRYDFMIPHGYGEDDHSNGIVREYAVPVKRVSGLPSHLDLDESTGWLYVIDNGNNRILRLQTKSGEITDELFTQNELLEEYSLVEGVQVETIDSGISKLCGIDVFQNRLIASVNSTGEIRMYDISTSTPNYMGSIQTGEAGIMGLKVGPDSAIWYVNRTKNKLVRVTPGEPLAVETKDRKSNIVAYPNPATNSLTISLPPVSGELHIFDALGRRVKEIEIASSTISLNVADLPNGVYHIRSNSHSLSHSFIIER